MPPQADEPRPAGFRLAWGLPIVYAVAVLARSSIIIVVPTLAYRSLGETSLVSAVYLVASLCGLLVSMSLPPVLQVLGAWRLLLITSLVGLAAAMFLCISGPAALIVGVTLHLLMVQLFETATNIYSLNIVARRQFAHFEPRRVMLAGLAFISGPFIGGWLFEYGPPYAPFILSGACSALVSLIMAWVLRGIGNPVAPPPPAGVRGGLAVREFFGRPRLRLAWILAIGRAGWWQMFFVYTPILAAAGGIGVSQAGTLAGMASALLLLAPLWGLIIRSIGLRRVFLAGYAACGIATTMAGFLVEWSFSLAAAALIAAAVAISGIDSAGNAPFLRAIRSRDRLRMVPIYNTYREMSQIIPAAVYTVLISVSGVASVFIASGVALVLLSIGCIKLPRRA